MTTTRLTAHLDDILSAARDLEAVNEAERKQLELEKQRAEAKHEANLRALQTALRVAEQRRDDELSAREESLAKVQAFAGIFSPSASADADVIDDSDIPTFARRPASNPPAATQPTPVLRNRVRNRFSGIEAILVCLVAFIGLVLAWGLCGFLDDLPVFVEQVAKVIFVGTLVILGGLVGHLIGSRVARRRATAPATA